MMKRRLLTFYSRTPMTDLSLLELDELRLALAEGRITPIEAVDDFLVRCRSAQERLNCFVHLDEAAARERALRLQREGSGRSRSSPSPSPSPLWGIPFAYKDIFATAGRSPAAGARLSCVPVARGESVVADIEGQGAIALGALSLDEISYGATGLNAHYGHCRNPWNTDYITGGSSSGAAAAVAAGAVPFAVCSDTAGSIRIPASLCGVTGFKPTYGSVRTDGTVPLSPSQDTVGVIARAVRDCSRVMGILQTHRGNAVEQDGMLPRSPDIFQLGGKPLAGLRMAICRHPFFDMSWPDGEQSIAAAFRVLEQLGARVFEQQVDGMEDCDAAATVITWTEVLERYGSCLATEAERISGATRIRLETATAVTTADYQRAVQHRPLAVRAFLRSAFANADLLVAPTITCATPRIDDLAGNPNESVKATTAFLRSNRCFSYLGLPALSVPAGFSEHGLPIGLQIIGRPWKDVDVLRCGAAYQDHTDWHRRRPILGPIC